MSNMEYANAYTEVLEILNYIPKEDFNKIPQDLISMYKEKCNKGYNFYYNPDITLDKQNVSKRAMAIIVVLFRDYWATKEQREKIIAKQNYDMEKSEKMKLEKFNPDDLFYKKTDYEENKIAVVELKKKSFFEKVSSFLRNIFRW